MSKLKRVYWLKLPKDFFQSKEIKKLQKRAGGDTYVKIYLKMLLLSLTNEGKIYFEQTEESLAEQLSIEIDEDINDIEVLLMYLEHNKLITKNENGVFMDQIPEMIGSETIDAERKRRERNAYKTIKLGQCPEIKGQSPDKIGYCPDVSKNVPNIEIDIEIDIDKELDIEIDKKIDKKKSDKIVDYVKTKALTYENNLIEFIEFRKNIKKPLTELGINKIINQLTKWGYNTNQIIEVLDNSIMNNWQGIFQLKENNYKNNSNKIIKNTVYTETKDEYDLVLEKILEGK